jgi:hypothetical protein
MPRPSKMVAIGGRQLASFMTSLPVRQQMRQPTQTEPIFIQRLELRAPCVLLGASDTSENTTKQLVADMVTSSTELNIKESYDTYFSKADGNPSFLGSASF